MLVNELELIEVESTYHILKTNPDHFRNVWSWCYFLNKFVTNTDSRIKW